jgi:epoxyqueuosine reductase
VFGVAHKADAPELDWWDGKGTPGNRILIRINNELSEWIEKTMGCRTSKLPYLIEKGGIFLKDAAVMAGLGSLGNNNMVITPEYGPRIRFRALLLSVETETTGPLEFNPCEGCLQPCRKACPVKAFAKTVFSEHELTQPSLPGTDGTYDRVTCNVKMQQDIEDAVVALQAGDEAHQQVRQSIDDFEEEARIPGREDQGSSLCVQYCRECELTCPVGK